MATEQILSTLTINKVDSEETFKKMKAAGLVNDDELYLTPEGVAGNTDQIVVSETEPTDAVEDDLWLDLSATVSEVEYLPLSGGKLTGTVNVNNQSLTSVGKLSFLRGVYLQNSNIQQSNVLSFFTSSGSPATISAYAATPLADSNSNVIANKAYVDNSLANYVSTDGGTLYGDIDLSSNSVIGLNTVTFANYVSLQSQDQSSVIVFDSEGTFGQIYISSTQTHPNQAVSKDYVDSNFQKVMSAANTGSINITLADSTDYTFTAVTSLALTAGTGSCHGFITFAASTPTVTLTGFTKVDGDITSAAASTVWEFSCCNKYIIFKNWSDV